MGRVICCHPLDLYISTRTGGEFVQQFMIRTINFSRAAICLITAGISTGRNHRRSAGVSSVGQRLDSFDGTLNGAMKAGVGWGVRGWGGGEGGGLSKLPCRPQSGHFRPSHMRVRHRDEPHLTPLTPLQIKSRYHAHSFKQTESSSRSSGPGSLLECQRY